MRRVQRKTLQASSSHEGGLPEGVRSLRRTCRKTHGGWMTKTEGILLGVGVVLAGVVYLQSRSIQEGKLALLNAEAAGDTSRLVFHNRLIQVQERLSFQTTKTVTLTGTLDSLRKAHRETTLLAAKFSLSFDSLKAIVTQRGTNQQSSVDSTVRVVDDKVDSLGFHVTVHAEVPIPPTPARVTWNISRNPAAIIAALERDPDGRIALRLQSDSHTTTHIDSVTTKVPLPHSTIGALLRDGIFMVAGVVIRSLLPH